MESVLARYRNLIILVGVLFLQVLGLAIQVKRGTTDGQDTRLIRFWVVGAITPFERVVVWAENSTGDVWHNYFYLRGVRAENRQLKEQIEQMRLEQVRLSQDAAQARRLQDLLAFKEQFVARTVAAQVIGSSGSDRSWVVYIDKGENYGLKRDMAVITADGIVGKILTVFPRVSQVLLINDQSSGVGAILEKSRLQGVLRGTPTGEIVLERIMSDEEVTAGETVLTSGGDQIFPKGLRIGTVTKVGMGKDLFLSIKVKSAADLSKLEEVLVLVEKQERQVAAEDKTAARAADILAQRLPSVPERPPDAAQPASGEGTGAAAAQGAGGKPQTAAKPVTATAGASGIVKPVAANASGNALPGQAAKLSGNPPAPKKAAAPTVPGSTTELPPEPQPAAPKTSNPEPANPQTSPQAPGDQSSPQ
jgi:rod shape-determining protein MreC